MYKFLIPIFTLVFFGCRMNKEEAFEPSFKLIPSEKFLFKSFVDCNMAEAWIGDTFRIFPGKYGEDPVWGYSNELEFASGKNPDEVFSHPMISSLIQRCHRMFHPDKRFAWSGLVRNRLSVGSGSQWQNALCCLS